MKRILIASLITSSVSSPIMANNESIKIPATGVIAHTVLSKAELAKIKNFEMKKAIEIAKEKGEISLTEHKTSIVNSAAEAYLRQLPESSATTRKKLEDLSSQAFILSEGYLWAEDVLEMAKKSAHKQELSIEMEALKARVTQSRKIRNDIETTISALQIELSKNKNIEQIRQIEETKKLLSAKDDELRAIMESKLILGDFEYNVHYITAHSEPQHEESELLRKVFKSISGLKDVKIEITGRADPRGNREYNINLAKERANVIWNIAKESGINEEQIFVNSYVSDVQIKRNRELHFFDRNTTVLIRKIK
ncbi:OmpA family protein [Vibrio vulnificus]|nr:OmpA family protein [Vibrio vulnificus]